MLDRFEGWIDPFRPAPPGPPPDRLIGFFAHYVRQVRPMLGVILGVGFLAALVEVSLFAFLGHLVDLARQAGTPETFLSDHGVTLMLMAVVALVVRPLVFGLHTVLVNQALAPSFTNLIRWQAHRHVLRQSLGYFQNDFAGRIANKVMQTGPALRQTVEHSTDAIWFALIYVVLTVALFLDADPLLVVPLALWIAGFGMAMGWFIPRLKDKAQAASEARSTLAGRIVDSYTNVATVKLFAHTEREDAYARHALSEHLTVMRDHMRLVTRMEITVWILNGVLIVGTGGLALALWSGGAITLGAFALAAGLILRINNMANWIMFELATVFDNIGTVQEGMATIARPHTVVDRPDARALAVPRGEICFERITFHYGKGGGVIDDLTLTVRAGERVGLVGRSGAGKSTLVSLLLRFHDLEGGRILIDGQDIASVTQDSLRAQIGVVTQDTSLLHRSVRDNILYGRPEASEAELEAAARQSHADEFIGELKDWHGRSGWEAHVGERGVKLSGGQRQRIAIARVLLKNAPILVLDEATSALDSEVEAAIQEQLYNLMAGKTVIAIAHRLSTIAAMDRLVVMDRGRIVEQGRHAELIERRGIYASLWARQSGGFLAHDKAAE